MGEVDVKVETGSGLRKYDLIGRNNRRGITVRRFE